MTTENRKEIVQLSGFSILFGMALIANLLIVGFTYRYHKYQVFLEERAHNERMRSLFSKEHSLKQEVIKIEGVKNWEETTYIKNIGK